MKLGNEALEKTARELKYNSIYIIIINIKKDALGKSFATLIPQPDVIFHRLSKLDFMGKSYHLKNSCSLMLEITFREGDRVSKMKKNEIIGECVNNLVHLGFIKSQKDVNFTDIRKEKYAYVIYDLNHIKNTGFMLKYLEQNGILSNGRFAEFQYLNMDKVIEHSMELAKKLNAKKVI